MANPTCQYVCRVRAQGMLLGRACGEHGVDDQDAVHGGQSRRQLVQVTARLLRAQAQRPWHTQLEQPHKRPSS